MKTEAKKKFALNAVPEAALEEAGLAKETILAAIPMDGVVLLTKDSMARGSSIRPVSTGAPVLAVTVVQRIMIMPATV